MDIAEKAKKIVASSIAGLGVLGSILGMGLKGKAAYDNQNLADVAQQLQTNSQDLLALAKQLQGEEGAKLQSVGEYISKLANKVAKGETPTEEEIKQAQAKLETIKPTDTPRHTETSHPDTNDTDKQDRGFHNNQVDKTNEVAIGGKSRETEDNTKDTGKGKDSSSSGKWERQDREDKISPPQGKSEKGDRDNKSSSGKPPAKGKGDGSEKTSTPATEEIAENIQNALQKIEEIGVKLKELEKAIADLAGKSETQAEELEDSGKQLNNLSEDLTEKATETEAAIDSQEKETLQQLQDFQQTMQQLSQTLQQVDEEATNTTEEAISQMNSQQQFFQDNLDRIIHIIRLLLQQDTEDEDASLTAKLTEVMENLHSSFSHLPQLLDNINTQLETQKEETEENINSLIQTLQQGESEIKQTVAEVATHIADTTTSELEDICQQIHHGITAATNRFVDSNIQWQEDFQTTTSSLIENLENLIEDAVKTNIDDTFPEILDKLTETVQQQQENSHQIQEIAYCFRQLTQITQDLAYASEIAKEMKQQLQNIHV
ncbi:MAG TPA: hypothetical protein IGQ44_05395 [Geminocystis sp. M7585_C2015_104]|nr:hypothetical protein [Geminocystis sp. M7585_C2015_104]